MPITLEWSDITLRLVLTLVAVRVLGIDRSERGRPLDCAPRCWSVWQHRWR